MAIHHENCDVADLEDDFERETEGFTFKIISVLGNARIAGEKQNRDNLFHGVADFSYEIERASPAQFHSRIKQYPCFTMNTWEKSAFQ